MSVKRHLIVVWVGVSLMANDVEYLLMCLLAICMSLEKCLFWSFSQVIIGSIVILWLSCISTLYILDINPLSEIWFANIFFHSWNCLFIFLILCFEVRCFIFWWNLIYLFSLLLLVVLSSYLRNYCLVQDDEDVCLYFHLWVLVLALTFRSLIPSELIFGYDMR